MQPSCYLSDLYRFAADLRMKGVRPSRGRRRRAMPWPRWVPSYWGQGNSNSAPTVVPGPL
jgi:hypothetical protein